MFFTYHGYSFAVKLWNWAFDMGKAAFGSPGDSFKNLVRQAKALAAKTGGALSAADEALSHIDKIQHVNYQYIKELQRKEPKRKLFKLLDALGPIPQFLWWCFGNKCTGGGDCQYQYSKWECHSFTGEASCQDKSGKQRSL